MDISIAGEAVDPTFFMVDDIGELISAGEANGIEDGPPPGPRGDVGEPVDVADGGGGEVVPGGVGREDELGDPAALVDQRRQKDLRGGDGVEEAEHALAAVEADGEGEPAVAGADASAPREDVLELEGAVGGERRGGGAAPGVVEDDEERRGGRRERASPGRAGAPRAGVALEVEAVADAAEEVRRQIRPAPERRHGGGGGRAVSGNGG